MVSTLTVLKEKGLIGIRLHRDLIGGAKFVDGKITPTRFKHDGKIYAVSGTLENTIIMQGLTRFRYETIEL